MPTHTLRSLLSLPVLSTCSPSAVPPAAARWVRISCFKCVVPLPRFRLSPSYCAGFPGVAREFRLGRVRRRGSDDRRDASAAVLGSGRMNCHCHCHCDCSTRQLSTHLGSAQRSGNFFSRLPDLLWTWSMRSLTPLMSSSSSSLSCKPAGLASTSRPRALDIGCRLS